MSAMAKWIWIQKEFCSRPEYVLFRKTLQLEEVPEELRLQVTADSRYILCINGHIVSRGPARSNTMVKFYDTVDIAPYLQAGRNVLTIDAVHYAGDAHEANEFTAGPTSIPTSARGGVLVDGDCRFCTNDSYRCLRLDAYQFKQAEVAEYLGYFEQVDGRLYPFGWRDLAYDDSGWEHAVERIAHVPYTRGGLANVWQTEPRPIPIPYEREEQFAGVTRTNAAGGERILDGGLRVEPHQTVFVELDAGVYKTGFVELEIVGGQGSRVKLLYSESYGRDRGGACYIKECRDDCAEDAYLLGDSDVYIAGSDVQTYTSFHYRAFRFVRLEVACAEEPIEVKVTGLRQTGYPLQVTTKFHCADTVYNHMWDISLRTLQCCMYETYMDCPHFEQMQYLMDTLLEALYTYSISTDSRLAEKAIRDFYEYQLPNGLIPCNAPTRIVQIIPVFTLYWIFMLYDHYQYFKNAAYIKDFFPGVEKIVIFFRSHLLENDLLGDTGFWQFVDWTKEWDNGVPVRGPQEQNLIYSMVLVAALHQAAYLAKVLERPDYAGQLTELAGRISAAVEKHGYDARRGLYRDVTGRDAFSQHGQVWAVLSGIALPERRKAIMRKALQDDTLVRCSLCTHYFLYRALDEVGLYTRTEELWDSWKAIMDMKVTTWPEDPVNWRSDCHAWSSTPLYEFVACGLGIKPEAPGFDVVRIEPKMLWLRSCEGSVHTRHGTITVSWTETDGVFSIRLQTQRPVPVVCVLPDGAEHREIVQGELNLQCELHAVRSPDTVAV